MKPQVPKSENATSPILVALVILWKPTSQGFEVFLGRRSTHVSFLPGIWTWPGGTIDETDPSPKEAAVRELKEETSVHLEASSLVSVARWPSPRRAPQRFDTHFFAAELPPNQTPDVFHSDGELMDQGWWTPQAALDCFAQGSLLLADPALQILEALRSGLSGLSDRLAAMVPTDYILPVARGLEVVPLRTPTLPPATHTNCVVVGDHDLVVIDPCGTQDGERQALLRYLHKRESQGHHVAAVWLTHHHPDHIGAATQLSQMFRVPIGAHPKTAELLQGICPVHEHLHHGQSRRFDGPYPRTLRCLHTPGHAPGHLCFLETTTNTLIAGDMVASVGTILIDPQDGDMADYLRSLKQLHELEARQLIPAHGFVVTNPKAILEHYVEHRLSREIKVMQALTSTPQSLSDLVPRVYADTPTNLHNLAQRSLLAHLVKLQTEGRCIRHGESWSQCK